MQTQLRIVDFCSFYLLRLWRWQPMAIAALSLSAVGLAAAALALDYYVRQYDVARYELQKLHASASITRVASVPVNTGRAELPPFDSAVFTADFHAAARDVGFPVDELTYVLENGPAQPYVRYRITLDVKAGYIELRRFIAAISAAQPNISLDNVRCRRDGAAAAALSCQLAFSAFFRKVDHG